MLTSEQLVVGNVYTRNELKAKFNIRDSTINTGVFRPKGHDSIWLSRTKKSSFQHVGAGLEPATSAVTILSLQVFRELTDSWGAS
jgi:hypothetical protein